MWTPRDALELMDALGELEFPEQMFPRIHPTGDSAARYRKYCEGLVRPFTRSSSSQLLCERMHRIVTHVRSSPSASNSDSWASIVANALVQVTTVANRGPAYSRLGDEHHRFLAEQLAKLVDIASNDQHSMKGVARWQIRNTLWRWTVDGVLPNGFVVVDAAKACPSMWPMTVRALGDDVEQFHEHVVPRVVITDYLIEQRMTDVDQLTTELRHHCLAAVVAPDDDNDMRKSGLRSSMPAGWRWGDDPWERYRVAGLYDTLVWPTDWPGSKP